MRGMTVTKKLNNIAGPCNYYDYIISCNNCDMYVISTKQGTIMIYIYMQSILKCVTQIAYDRINRKITLITRFRSIGFL